MIHQPHFLPWPPYMARVVFSEVFVVLDDLPFRKDYYQNRTKLIDKNRGSIWITLPVNKVSNSPIRETRLAKNNYEHVINEYIETMEHNYSKYPYFHEVWGTVKDYMGSIGSNEKDNLSTINTDSILLLCSLLDLTPPMIKFSSELGTRSLERTNRILKIFELMNKKILLTGWGGGLNPKIHDIRLLKSNGITIKGMDKQTCTNLEPDFILNSGISTLHWIFLKGPDYVKERLILYNKSFL